MPRKAGRKRSGSKLSISLKLGLQLLSCFTPDVPGMELSLAEVEAKLNQSGRLLQRCIYTLLCLGLLESTQHDDTYRRTGSPISSITPEILQAVVEQGVQVCAPLAMGLWIISCIENAPTELEAADILRKTDISGASTYKYLADMLRMKYIQRNRHTGKYRMAGTSSVDPEVPVKAISDDVISVSLMTTLKVLACFKGDSSMKLRQYELAEKCGLATNAMYRYVRTLVAIGLLEQDGPRGSYRLATARLEPDLYNRPWNKEGLLDSTGKGMAVFSYFAYNDSYHTPGEIAEYFGDTLSAVWRYIRTLEVEGCLVRHTNSYGFRVNPLPSSSWLRYFLQRPTDQAHPDAQALAA